MLAQLHGTKLLHGDLLHPIHSVIENIYDKAQSHFPHMNRTTAISSHRDSHGNFIKKLIVGDEIHLQDLYKEWHYYIVDDFLIINVHDQNKITNTKGLLLITCYPFNAITSGTPLRYIVSAKKITNNKPKNQSFLSLFNYELAEYRRGNY